MNFKGEIKKGIIGAVLQVMGAYPLEPSFWNNKKGRTFKRCPLCNSFLYIIRDKKLNGIYFDCISHTCRKIPGEEFFKKVNSDKILKSEPDWKVMYKELKKWQKKQK